MLRHGKSKWKSKTTKWETVTEVEGKLFKSNFLVKQIYGDIKWQRENIAAVLLSNSVEYYLLCDCTDALQSTFQRSSHSASC